VLFSSAPITLPLSLLIAPFVAHPLSLLAAHSITLSLSLLVAPSVALLRALRFSDISDTIDLANTDGPGVLRFALTSTNGPGVLRFALTGIDGPSALAGPYTLACTSALTGDAIVHCRRGGI
jgi:hypothetical protein